MSKLKKYKDKEMKNPCFKCCYQLVLLEEKIKEKIEKNFEIAEEWFYRDDLLVNDALRENDALKIFLMWVKEMEE